MKLFHFSSQDHLYLPRNHHFFRHSQSNKIDLLFSPGSQLTKREVRFLGSRFVGSFLSKYRTRFEHGSNTLKLAFHSFFLSSEGFFSLSSSSSCQLLIFFSSQSRKGGGVGHRGGPPDLYTQTKEKSLRTTIQKKAVHTHKKRRIGYFLPLLSSVEPPHFLNG